MNDRGRARTALWTSTLAFTVCFAVWMMNGVLVTHLVGNRVFDWSKTLPRPMCSVPEMMVMCSMPGCQCGGTLKFGGNLSLNMMGTA